MSELPLILYFEQKIETSKSIFLASLFCIVDVFWAVLSLQYLALHGSIITERFGFTSFVTGVQRQWPTVHAVSVWYSMRIPIWKTGWVHAGHFSRTCINKISQGSQRVYWWPVTMIIRLTLPDTLELTIIETFHGVITERIFGWRLCYLPVHRQWETSAWHRS